MKPEKFGLIHSQQLKTKTNMCGVFGIFSEKPRNDLTEITVMALASMQHRGQEAAGMAWKEGRMKFNKGHGLVNKVFNPIPRPSTHSIVGHVRYATTGGIGFENENVQPFIAHLKNDDLAVVHNGNFSNSDELRSQLLDKGSILSTTSDTEVILHFLAIEQDLGFSTALKKCMGLVRGAYNILMLKNDDLVAIRDPWGFRCLFWGKIDGCDVFASEDTAIYNAGGEVIRGLLPGEMIHISADGVKTEQIIQPEQKRLCSFEYIYFSRPDCILDRHSVYHARKEVGRKLARQNPVEVDFVSGIPDSGLIMSLGYAEESGLPHEMVISRNRYVGRSFIEPTQEMRKIAVKQKLAPTRSLIQNKSILLIDDSLVRGTTTKQIVTMLKDAGAKEVHLRIGSPPVRYPCFYGIDTPKRKDLIAANNDMESVRKYTGAKTLAYLDIEDLKESIGTDQLCMACFNKNYLEGDNI